MMITIAPTLEGPYPLSTSPTAMKRIPSTTTPVWVLPDVIARCMVSTGVGTPGRVWFRKQPGMADVHRTLAEGERVNLLEGSVLPWLRVADESGVIGYVLGRYLTCEED